MKRRTALLALLLAPIALAQDRKLPRVGFFYFGTRESVAETGRLAALLQGMREAGYQDGKNFVLEARYADGDPTRYEAIAAELIQAKVDVIVSTATPIHHVLKKQTSVPIVITVSADPVGEGLAASLAKPGGNITGMSSSNAELSAKYFEVLRDAVPSVSRIFVLHTTLNRSHTEQLAKVRAAAARAGAKLQARNVAKAQDIEPALSEIARSRPDALLVLSDAMFLQHARKLTDFALRQKLPTMFGIAEFPEAGGLMSYGPDIRDNYRRSAKYVDRILKGAKPGDLPMEQPNKYGLVINLKTAKAIGVQISKVMQFRADRLIE